MFEPVGFKSLQNSPTFETSVEEVLLDSDSSRLHTSLESGFDRPKSINLFSLIVVVVMGIVAIRLFDLQMMQGQDLRLAAEGNRIRAIAKFAPRGLILDRFGEIIARNQPNFELMAVPYDLLKGQDLDSQLTELSSIINVGIDEMKTILSGVSPEMLEPVVLKSSLTQDEALKLEDLVSRYPGFRVQSAPIREYLNGEVFAHLVGYAGKLNRDEWEQNRESGYIFNDVIGKSGVESVYESQLRGKHGQIEIEVDAQGQLVKNLGEAAPVPGENLQLTIDVGLQKVLYA